MSLAEVAPYEPENRGPDRTPPQDMSAEQCVLGAMLMSKDAIADVIEQIRGNDFYRPAHELIYEAVIDLYGRGEPADAITVAAELTKRGEIGRIGGHTYLHDLLASVPIAANAGYYAEIVREKAILRRLVEASIKIAQMGYSGQGDVDDIVDSAQQEVYQVTDRRSSEDYKPLSDLMEATLDEIEAIGSRGGQMAGVPTGFIELDELTNGLHSGQMVIVAARPAMGKALALDTPLPTPTGWTTMGEVAVGDFLIDADGKPTKVVAATEVMEDRPCYELRFSDGTTVIADAQHEWRVETPTLVEPVETTSGESDETTGSQTFELVDTSSGTATPVEPAQEFRAEAYTLTTEQLAQRPGDERGLPRWSVVSARALEGTEASDDPARDTLDQRRSNAALVAAKAGVRVGDATEFDVSFKTVAEAQAYREVVISIGLVATVSHEEGNSTVTVDVHSDRRWITGIRQIDSVPVRCVEVDNPDHLYLATESMIPTHNSTLGLDLARAASIKNGLCSAIFSLEMSQVEITMRLLSAEAQIPLNHIRKGTMTDEDWTRLAKKMGEVSEAPLFIDDSPNLTMMEIRAKARRLKQRHDLKLVIIDYMQLMTSGKKVESRQLEVSEFSRQLKLLAKELEVPVVAISQLNRGPEQRNDKKPMLSDLRESGCLTADTRMLRADTGEEVAMGDLLASGARNIPVWSLDENKRLVPRTMTHVFPSGVKEVFRLTLASGRQIKATANHPFLTLDGWMPLGELTEGSRLAAPRRLPEPQQPTPWDDDEVTVLAHLLGDGSFVRRQPIRYASVDEENLTAVTEAARRRFGITAERDEYAAARVTSLRLPAPYHLTHGRRNPIASWLDGMGLFGLRSHEKFIPAGVFGLPTEQVRAFVRHLWATDGSVRWDATAGMGRIYYASTSRRLVDDLARLLLRCGIYARIKTVPKSGYRDSYHLIISGVEQQLIFCDQIGVHGARGAKVTEVAGRIRTIRANTNLDTVPKEVWGRVRAVLAERKMSHRQFAAAMETQFCGSAMWRRAPSRARLAKTATVLEDEDLAALAESDVYWDSVVSIESLGEEEVFDATVLGTHNFMADGIAVHNSLEQDADMVILLSREDAYDKESPRLGEADFIVAKHRNGPTKTIVTAFQGHYSRFVDMQH